METEKGFYFASEIKSLSYSHDIKTQEVNLISLQDYLAYQYVPEPNTILKNIYILEPGCTIEKKFGEEDTISI